MTTTRAGREGRARQRQRPLPVPLLVAAAAAMLLLLMGRVGAVGGGLGRTPALPSLLPWRGTGGSRTCAAGASREREAACSSSRQRGGSAAAGFVSGGERGSSEGPWWAGLQRGLGGMEGHVKQPVHAGSTPLATAAAVKDGAQRLGEDAKAAVSALAAVIAGPPAALLRRLHATPLAQIGPLRLGMPALHVDKTLTFWGNMLAGAVSRSCAQTAMHPANVIKTLLQTKGSTELQNLNFRILTRGAGAQFVLSLPHGALAFAVLEATKATLSSWFPLRFAGPAFDFVSSAVSTTLCSVISTPQMVLTDRIMAGYYPNLVSGVRTVLQKDGVAGLYAGWFAALAQKIPSYGLTWVFFQQLKQARNRLMDHDATNGENFAMGSLAAAATVCVMIPLDTVKTRIVTQAANPLAGVPYKNVADCFMRVLREEGLKTFYAPLAPRLVSVVPMIGIQFGVYEFMKRAISSLPERPATAGISPPPVSPPPPTKKGKGKKGKKADADFSKPPLSELLDEIEDQV